MARIRTVKPDFFKHYELFLLEKKTSLPMRLGFQGLWLCADKEGRFKWKPEALKLDILPYDDCDFEDVLIELGLAGFIKKYESEGKTYGYIPTFKDHQRITGTEAKSESRIPDPKNGVILETTRKQQGNNKEILSDADVVDITNSLSNGITLETTRKQQGNTLDDWKGREGKGREGKRKGTSFDSPAGLDDFFSRMMKRFMVGNPNYSESEEDLSALYDIMNFIRLQEKVENSIYDLTEKEENVIQEVWDKWIPVIVRKFLNKSLHEISKFKKTEISNIVRNGHTKKVTEKNNGILKGQKFINDFTEVEFADGSTQALSKDFQIQAKYGTINPKSIVKGTQS